MQAAEEHPRLYADFQKVDLTYLHRLVAKDKISPAIVRKLLDYWELRLSEERDPLYSNYFEYYLFFESINTGILSAFVFDIGQQKVKHQYGVLAATTVQILQKIKPSESSRYLEYAEKGYIDIFDYEGSKLSLYLKSIEFGKRKYLIGVLYPLNIQIKDKLSRLENVFQRFYLPDIFQPDHRFLPLFHELNESILPQLRQVLTDGEPVTFTYFKFEPFGKYINLAGEHFASQIVNGLVDQLTEKLKKEDSCYVLNPREYLVISLRCEKEVLEGRYHRVMFQIKSLLLSYQVKYTTIREDFDDLSKIFEQIAIVE